MDLRRININLNGSPTPPLADDSEEIVELENKMGFRLPSEYIGFLKTHDGGHPEIGSIILGEEDPANIFDVDWFYSASNPAIKNLSEAIDEWKPVLGDGALPFGQDAGGNQFYLNLSDKAPAVWLLLHDQEGKKIKIADNFSTFISMLQENPDFI